MVGEQDQLSQEEIQERIKLMKENCLFCKIIKKEIPSQIIFEDDICIAILDINPATNGHLLLMPKEHYMMLPMVPDQILSHMSIISKYLSDLIVHSLGAQDVKIYMANGAVAGQQAQHYMLHIIPQYGDDNYAIETSSEEIPKETIEDLKLKMKEKISLLNSQSN